MKNAMQLKATIKNISRNRNISAQIVMQNYMLERLLERISVSRYQSNFILKGGFYIAAMVGLDTRATMDMDATVRGLAVSQDAIRHMFEEICGISLNDDISFSVKRIEDIREDDEYSGLRVMLEATYPPMVVPLKIDITTGDQITPREIVYEFRLLLEPRSIKILAYSLETVMAEKLETVISRGDQNTRSRDYYDIYILRKLEWQNITPDSLRLALVATAIKRNSLSIMERYSEILQTVSSSEVMNGRWLDYQSDFDYARDILFSDICGTIKEILDSLNTR
ncbi:MAG: nucleotidyl transferase AbiEii/AbiGii toxin family protein [Caldiserica bacterium]|nr:nucleotidyl transferase AbiEii/AbiGii toxin family protein [Caldisericota bacterium]